MRLPARCLVSVVATFALGGCAVFGFADGLGEDGTDPTVPEPAPELEQELPEEPRGVAGRIGSLLIGPDSLPLPPLVSPSGASGTGSDTMPATDPTATRNAVQDAAPCPRMPTFGLDRPRTRRPFDFDSIRALPPEVSDSLARSGALPRLDTLVVVPEDGPATRMPVVRLDSTGLPIRVVPLCRVVGRGR